MCTQVLQLTCIQPCRTFNLHVMDIWKHGSKTTFLLHIKHPQHSRTEENKYVGKYNVYFLKMRYKYF